MRREQHICILLLMLLFCMPANAQERRVQNKPYIDLRPFHFGVLVGFHAQDIELTNTGIQTITLEDGSSTEKLVSCDQDRWDLGFTVGVLGETRLSEHFAARIAPTMYFGNRHLTFLNHTDHLENGEPIVMKQDMKSVYVSSPVDVIFASKRFNNHRPYVLAGVNPMINLSGKDSDILRLKRYDVLLELGLGCDFYLPFFKLRPELKFGFGLIDSKDADHVNQIKDKNLLIYTNSVSQARTKFVSFTFYFE